MAATPTKFSLGGMPRTRTGLVPTTYQRTADQLSEPRQWEQLPTKPKPTLYPFRGDFVNAKNRKITRERNAARKEKLRLLNSRRSSGGESLGSSLLVAPCSQGASMSSSQEIASDSTKQWDSYTKHISCHRLSDEQERSRTQNKSKFSDWLRSEAFKRQQRKGRGGKENRQNEEQAVVRPRKPPVPRLSRLARGGGKKEKRSGYEQSSKPPQPKETAPEQSAEGAQTKVRYLDFITEKMEEPEKPKGCASESAEPAATDDDDDESKFRSQIERIVQRAAEMVLTEQPNEPDDATREEDESTDASPEASPDASDAAREQELIQSRNELAVLEEKLRQLSSSSVAASDAPSLSSSALIDSREAGSLAMLDDTVASSHRDIDSLSEAMPRDQMQPMSVPAWREGTFDSSIDASSILRGLALSSRGTESSFQVSDSRDLTTSVDVNFTAASDASDANDAGTSMPRELPPDLSQQQSNAIRLEPCPEEAAMPPVQPSLVPQRVHWDEAPLPRGIGESYEASMTSDSYGARVHCEEEEPLPRGFNPLQPPKTGQALVDDLLAMLDDL